MFTDDLENTIKRLYKTQIDIISPKDSSQVKNLLADYIRKHLQIKIDGRPVALQLIGFEKEGGAIWSYLQAEGVGAVKKVEIMNDLLYESFDAQISIMHLTVNGQRKSLKLNNPEKNAMFSF
jgi:hypothetical protein